MTIEEYWNKYGASMARKYAMNCGGEEAVMEALSYIKDKYPETFVRMCQRYQDGECLYNLVDDERSR